MIGAGTALYVNDSNWLITRGTESERYHTLGNARKRFARLTAVDAVLTLARFMSERSADA